MEKVDKKLYSLSLSKFRSSFHLNKKMKEYVRVKGYDVIESHAYDFIHERFLTDGQPQDMKRLQHR